MKLKIIPFYILIISLFNSCIGDVDFDQSKDIMISPVAKVAVLQFNVKQTDFINSDTGEEIPVRLDFTDINIFNNSIAENDIDHAIFKFEIDNNFNKKFIVNYYLMDNENTILEIIPFNVDENSSLVKNIEFIRGTTSYDNLIKTKRINVVVNLVPNANTMDNTMFLHFKSALDIYLNIDNE